MCLYPEIKTIIQTNLRPATSHKVSGIAPHKPQAVSEIQPGPPPIYQQQQKKPPGEEEQGSPEKTKPDPSTRQGVSPALMTTFLLIPLVLVVSIAVFIRWRKSRVYGGGMNRRISMAMFSCSNVDYCFCCSALYLLICSSSQTHST